MKKANFGYDKKMKSVMMSNNGDDTGRSSGGGTFSRASSTFGVGSSSREGNGASQGNNNVSAAALAHEQFLPILSSLSDEIARSKLSHGTLLANRREGIVKEMARCLTVLSDNEFRRTCECVRKLGGGIGGVLALQSVLGVNGSAGEWWRRDVLWPRELEGGENTLQEGLQPQPPQPALQPPTYNDDSRVPSRNPSQQDLGSQQQQQQEYLASQVQQQQQQRQPLPPPPSSPNQNSGVGSRRGSETSFMHLQHHQQHRGSGSGSSATGNASAGAGGESGGNGMLASPPRQQQERRNSYHENAAPPPIQDQSQRSQAQQQQDQYNSLSLRPVNPVSSSTSTSSSSASSSPSSLKNQPNNLTNPTGSSKRAVSFAPYSSTIGGDGALQRSHANASGLSFDASDARGHDNTGPQSVAMDYDATVTARNLQPKPTFDQSSFPNYNTTISSSTSRPTSSSNEKASSSDPRSTSYRTEAAANAESSSVRSSATNTTNTATYKSAPSQPRSPALQQGLQHTNSVAASVRSYFPDDGGQYPSYAPSRMNEQHQQQHVPMSRQPGVDVVEGSSMRGVTVPSGFVMEDADSSPEQAMRGSRGWQREEYDDYIDEEGTGSGRNVNNNDEKRSRPVPQPLNSTPPLVQQQQQRSPVYDAGNEALDRSDSVQSTASERSFVARMKAKYAQEREAKAGAGAGASGGQQSVSC